MKIVSLIGARPQFIKAGVVSRAIKNYNASSFKKRITEIVLHTGQHFDSNMSASFLSEFNIRSAYNLGIQESLHGKMTARMIEGIESVLLDEKPDAVIVYGDTNSTLAGSLAAAKLDIPIAHVEAGLRSFNMKMPEEINRILTDRISTWLFCPTLTAVENLGQEGIGRGNQNVINAGDVMFDAFLRFKKIARPGTIINDMINSLDGPYYIATIHRSENTDSSERLLSIIGALEEISRKRLIIIPLHPRTRKKLQSMNIELKNVYAIDPVGYLDMIFLLKNCHGVFTDSGGLQKEAYFMNKLCVTIRDETEWVELTDNGFNILAGAQRDNILKAEKDICSRTVDWNQKFYGDGKAGEKIVQTLVNGFPWQ